MADSARALQKQFWSRDLSGEDLREAAYGFADSLDNSVGETDRRAQLLKYANQYLPQPITNLRDFESSSAAISGGTPAAAVGRCKRNSVRTLVDTALSRFAKTETRVQFLTDGGRPEQQERAETATDASNALLEQTQAEKHLRKAALHACVFDLGVVKTIEHDDGPELEHVPAWELMFDPTDSHRGKPSIAVQRFPADIEALVADYATPDEDASEEDKQKAKDLADLIRESTSAGLVAVDNTATEQHCLVYELWRLPVGRGKKRKPGRHIICTDRALLLDEKWTDEGFPFTIFVWSEPTSGCYGVSIAAIVFELQQERDATTTRISQILRKMAVPRFIRSGPTEVQITVGSDAIGDIINEPPGVKITETSADHKVGGELFTYDDGLKAEGYEMTGISSSSAVGSRPAGLNSAPAQREWNEINQDRLSLVALDYQDAHVDVATKLLVAVSKIPDYEISIKTPDGRWLKKVKAADLNLADSDYVIQRFPVGALPTTPTGKLAAAADLLQAKAISLDEFRDMVQFPDLKAKLSAHRQSERATEALISKMLRTGKYEAPLEMLDPKFAVPYVTTRYLEGIASDPPMPDDRLEMLANWLDDFRKRLEPKTPPAGAAPMPGPGDLVPPPGGPPPPGIAPVPIAPPPPLAALPVGADFGVAA